MYLRGIHIERFKRLADLRLEFTEPDGKIRKWTVLIGPNGTGKTSILQAIAMTAVGSAELNNLANEVREPRGDAWPWRAAIDDLRATAAYRRDATATLLRRAFGALAS